MGSGAQIDQITAAVDSDGSSILDLTVDDRHLERVSREHLQCVFLGDHESLESLLA